MNLPNRLKSLETRHSRLEDMIHAEMISPAMDADRIRAMKRERLKLKDEIFALKERAAA